MVLGMSLRAFTFLHVAISLVAIASGLAVIAGFLTGRKLDRTTILFLVTTALTCLTGFLFPFHGVTPGIVLGVIGLVSVAISAVTRYQLHLAWRKSYVIAACASLYFNVFVLTVQLFEKVPALHALAPTQKEPPFAIAQLVVLTAFIIMTVLSVRRFRETYA